MHAFPASIDSFHFLKKIMGVSTILMFLSSSTSVPAQMDQCFFPHSPVHIYTHKLRENWWQKRKQIRVTRAENSRHDKVNICKRLKIEGLINCSYISTSDSMVWSNLSLTWAEVQLMVESPSSMRSLRTLERGSSSFKAVFMITSTPALVDVTITKSEAREWQGFCGATQ